MKKENKIIAHIAVLLTLLVIVALIMPLKGSIGRDDMGAVARIVIMEVTSILAMIFFVKSFIDARKARKNEFSNLRCTNFHILMRK